MDRWLNSSPPLPDLSSAPSPELLEYERDFDVDGDVDGAGLDVNSLSAKEEVLPVRSLFPPVDTCADTLFQPVPDFQEAALTKSAKSYLSNLLISKDSPRYDPQNTRGKVKLTIYLPDYTSMKVYINDTSTFGDLITLVLYLHKDSAKKPPLMYDNPEFYELRMHEGDGDPDYDFAALDKKKKIRNHNENEYCVCEVKNLKYLQATALTQGNISSRSSKGLGGDNTVTVHYNNSEMVLTYGDDTTLRDLLPMMEKKHRLRLFTEEYSFYIYNREEQAKKMLTSPLVDISSNVKKLQIKEFELKKKKYADTIYIERQNSEKESNLQSNAPYNQQQFSEATDNAIIYTDATASVYQEWNIIKKNKYGQKQERILGVDGFFIYNSKRERYSRNPVGVRRAQRDIQCIRRIEPSTDDSKGFKILWEGEKAREVVEIEYSCETARERQELLAKITFLMGRIK